MTPYNSTRKTSIYKSEHRMQRYRAKVDTRRKMGVQFYGYSCCSWGLTIMVKGGHFCLLRFEEVNFVNKQFHEN